MNASSNRVSVKRKLAVLKRRTDPDVQSSSRRWRPANVGQTSVACGNGDRKSEAATPTRRRPAKPAGTQGKNAGSAKKKRAVRAKRPIWVESVCRLQTLSVPIITRSMSKCFDAWKSGGRPRPDVLVAGPRTAPRRPNAPRRGAREPATYRPIISRSRKLQLRQKILNYMYQDAGPCRGEPPTLGSAREKGDISTQTLDDVFSPRLHKLGPSPADGRRMSVPYSDGLATLEACVQADLPTDEMRSSLGQQRNDICDQYDLDPDLYRIHHSPVQHDPMWLAQDSRNAANRHQTSPQTQHVVETMDESAKGGAQREENSAIWPHEMSPELSPKNSLEIFRSSGFQFQPRNSASINLGFSFSEPFWSNGLPDSVTVENKEYSIYGLKTRDRLPIPAASPRPSMSLEHGTFQFVSQAFSPRGKSERVERSRRSKRDYRRLPPKEVKVLNDRKSEKQKPCVASPSCLCCRENMRHVCRCCLKIRSKLRPKSSQIALDVPSQPEPKPSQSLERVFERKNSLDASIEAAQHIYKKLKEIIRFYRCSDEA